MNDLIILHLSDLHITSKGLNKSLNNLIGDIKEQAENIRENRIVIVS